MKPAAVRLWIVRYALQRTIACDLAQGYTQPRRTQSSAQMASPAQPHQAYLKRIGFDRAEQQGGRAVRGCVRASLVRGSVWVVNTRTCSVSARSRFIAAVNSSSLQHKRPVPFRATPRPSHPSRLNDPSFARLRTAARGRRLRRRRGGRGEAARLIR